MTDAPPIPAPTWLRRPDQDTPHAAAWEVAPGVVVWLPAVPVGRDWRWGEGGRPCTQTVKPDPLQVMLAAAAQYEATGIALPISSLLEGLPTTPDDPEAEPGA